jgi:tetratricopeptide (TPR) repeat protein
LYAINQLKLPTLRYFIAFILLIPFTSFGQIKTDSLLSIWNNSSVLDTTRTNALYVVIKDLVFTNPDSVIKLSQELYLFSEKRDLSSMVALSYKMKGIAQNVKGSYDAALDNLNLSLDIYKELKDTVGIIIVQNNLGVVHRKKGNVKKAIRYFSENLDVAKGYSNISYAKRTKHASLANIGQLYRHLRDNERARIYYAQVLEDEAFIDKETLAPVLNNMGQTYLTDHILDSALHFMNRSLELYKEINNNKGYATCLGNIGNVYKRMRDSLSAMKCYRRSLKISKSINDKNNIGNVLVNLAAYYLLFKNLDSALVYGQALMTVTKELGNIELATTAAHLMHQIHKERGENIEALEMYQRHVHLRDSMLNKEHYRTMVEEEYERKLEQNLEKQLSEKNLIHYREKIVLFILFVSILIFVLVYWLKRSQQNTKEKEALLYTIKDLKNKALVGMLTVSEDSKDFNLDKEKIETAIRAKLNSTDWSILNIIFKKPSITNKEIAAKISLSYDGTSSSLRKMYRLFELKVTKNHKMELIIKATTLSQKE